MATLKPSKGIGVIAEDLSDVQVVEALLTKYSDRNRFFIKKFVGNGCGKLKNKCRAWAATLLASGCHHVFLLHDLDRKKEAELRAILEDKLPCSAFPTSVIVIPVEELEAWLLSDEAAIKAVFSLKTAPKRYPNTEKVKSPKEELGRIVWSLGRKRYLNTVHNRRIAEKVTLDNLRRCRSFMILDDYIQREVFAA